MNDDSISTTSSIRPKKLRRFAVPTALVLIATLSLFIYLKNKYPTTSPLKSIKYISYSATHPHEKMAKETIGFLPYWRMDDVQYIKSELVSEIIFFSLTSDENGDIVKIVGNETDPGWRWWKSPNVQDLIAKTQIGGGKFSVAVAMQDNSTIESFLNSKEAQKNLISNLLQLVSESRINGINLDFEYVGELSDEVYKEKFTEFTRELTTEFRKSSPDTELSIDLYPLSARDNRLFDVNALSEMFDKFIVMSYDYYSASSTVSGPVAPMNGFSEEKYFFDVTTTYNDYLKILPKEKIIMGIPYYSWNYPVETAEPPMSPVLPQNDENGYVTIMSYGRMRTNTEINQNSCVWDDLAKQNFCSYTDSATGKFRQIWIEDNRSLEIKFDFVNEKDLGGIAIWTLGYDKDYPDLWEMIGAKFTFQK
jgi:spore germination protein YaaH